MFNFYFLLEENANLLGSGVWFGLLAVMIIMFIMSARSNKKKDQEIAAMRDNLAVGDEITTIGGVIGKVVSIKEETFGLETTKDRTKIRFHKRAIASVDVSIAEIAAAQVAEKAEAETTGEEN